jgi:hypothetical protein
MSEVGRSTAQPLSELQRERRLLYLAEVVAVTTPGFINMRRDQELHGWAADLVKFGERDDLRPLSNALGHIASNVSGQYTFVPLLRTLDEDSREIDLHTLVRASMVSEEVATASPHASLMLAWAALCIWILGAEKRGEGLYRQAVPWPEWPPGWRYIPAACAAAAAKLHGLYGARLLVKEAYEVLQVNRRNSRYAAQHGDLDPDIAKYRGLAQNIGNRIELAIGNLADEIREGCLYGKTRTRSLIAALLWSFGLIPECEAFQSNPEPPSRRLLRRLIQRSIDLVPHDPLIQYIWLELKDDTGIDLRGHEALLAVFNHWWGQWRADEEFSLLGLSAAPSRLYARTLAGLLAGTLDQADAGEYLRAHYMAGRIRPIVVGHRMSMLQHLIGVRFNYYGRVFTDKEKVEYLRRQTEVVGHDQEEATHYPELPEVLGRTGHPSFEMIEQCLADDARLCWSENERCVLVLETLERMRTGTLMYWLRVNPPLLSVSDNEKLRDLLEEERTLLQQLRGAYFLALRPTLPINYSRPDIDGDTFLAFLDDPAKREQFYSPEIARKEMDQIEHALAGVAERLQTPAPEYAALRRMPNADHGRLVAALNRHSSPPTNYAIGDNGPGH